MSRTLPEYWVCPECGRKFAKEGQGHVHGTWTVEEHLADRPAASVRLYERFLERLRALGPLELAATRNQIGLQTNRIFAGVRVTERGVRAISTCRARSRAAVFVTSRRTRSDCGCTTSSSRRRTSWTTSSPAG